MTPTKLISYALYGLVALAILLLVLWFFFFRPSTPAPSDNSGGNLGIPADNTGGTNNTGSSNGTQPVSTSGQTSQNKVFQITSSPVVGATLIQTLHPTTTLARYIRQEDGHVFDLPLDVAGAVPRTVSNVTIPGGQRAVWVEGGGGAVMQYLDGDTVKSVYLGFPTTATSSPKTLPTRIQFLPDAIVDIAASPDGKSVTYLLKTASGVDGYTAKPDGTGGKKLFSLPLSQVLISWPSGGTLLAQTKSFTGVPGIIFSVDIKSGAVTPLVYADGLTAIADSTFSKIIYQTTSAGAETQSTYAHDVKLNTDRRLSFDPFTEQCVFSRLLPSVFYCAVPEQNVAANFLDLWHLGAQSAMNGIFIFNVALNSPALIATPGSQDGGVASDILEMALSPNEKYLSFTTKGPRALWGVRLPQ